MNKITEMYIPVPVFEEGKGKLWKIVNHTHSHEFRMKAVGIACDVIHVNKSIGKYLAHYGKNNF